MKFFLTSLVLLAFIGFSVEAASPLITCVGKKPSPVKLLLKFASCAGMVAKDAAKGCQCIVKAVAGKDFSAETAIKNIKSYVPDKYKEVAGAEMKKHCAPLLPAVKTDTDGSACKKVSDCVLKMYNDKLCK